MSVIKMPRTSKSETEIAVLQVQMKNVEEKVEEVRSQVKEMHDSADSHASEVRILLKEMQESAQEAHTELSKKISSLEKWRYMMMGAGIVMGYLGFDLAAKLLQTH